MENLRQELASACPVPYSTNNKNITMALAALIIYAHGLKSETTAALNQSCMFTGGRTASLFQGSEKSVGPSTTRTAVDTEFGFRTS